MADICREACKAAKAHGVKISCDLNYRGKLWTREQARKAMTELCRYVDVCISNEEDAKDVFGIEAAATDIAAGELNKEGCKSVARQLMEKFGFEKVAITLRESKSAFDNDWSAMLYDGENYCFSRLYHLHIVDRIGGGDSFGGGLIYALLNGYDTQNAVEFAVAASALKHSVEGDYNMVTKVQYGAAWWLSDHWRGIRAQLDELMETGALAASVGMLTDSRSFTSFVRHEYYRRVLCQRLGELVESGMYPADLDTLGQLAEDVCYGNAERFFSE